MIENPHLRPGAMARAKLGQVLSDRACGSQRHGLRAGKPAELLKRASDVGQPARAFKNFSAARDEVAISRIYAGVHYFPAVYDGLTQGQCIGQRVLDRVKTRRAK